MLRGSKPIILLFEWLSVKNKKKIAFPKLIVLFTSFAFLFLNIYQIWYFLSNWISASGKPLFLQVDPLKDEQR